jgi:hypothetical protein
MVQNDSLAKPALTADCYEALTKFSRQGDFYWETSQYCTGSYGSQNIQTQMWRSS